MQTENLSFGLDQLLSKVEQCIRDHGYAVVWSTGELTRMYCMDTRYSYATLPDGTNAVTDFITKRVIIRTDLSQRETVRSLTHELGHVILTNRLSTNERTYELDEWAAESFANFVLSHYGLALANQSDEYLAGYSFYSNRNDEQVAVDRAKQAADEFVSALVSI